LLVLNHVFFFYQIQHTKYYKEQQTNIIPLIQLNHYNPCFNYNQTPKEINQTITNQNTQLQHC